MILIREVFQAKYGQGDSMVALFKEAQGKWLSEMPSRLLVDLSGRFFTFVVEIEVESLGEWEARMAQLFATPETADWFARMTDFVESGHREFYTIAG